MRSATRAVFGAMTFLGAVLASFSARADECSLQRVALLDVKTDESGSVLVPITVGGKDAALVLDTGASASFLSDSFAQGVSGERGRTTYQFGLYFRDAAGEIMSEFVKVKSLKIGDIETGQSAHFIIASDDAMASVDGTKGDGLLGNNITMNFDLEIDPAGRKVGFYIHHDCDAKPPVYWSREWVEIPIKKLKRCKEKDPRECANMPGMSNEHIIIDVTLDGKTVPALIDTGASASVLDTETAEAILGRKSVKEGSTEVVTTGSGEQVETYRANFKSLSFSGITVQNPQFLITDVFIPEAKMVIGMDKLRHLHTYFAFKQRKIYATAAQ